jgi:hypothetical protein
MAMRASERRARLGRRLRLTLVTVVAALVVGLTAGTSDAAKLFVTLDSGGGGGFRSFGPVLRYDISGPDSAPTLDAAIVHPSFDGPCCVAFDESGALFVSNTGNSLVPGAGSITRIFGAGDLAQIIGPFTSPQLNGPYQAAFKNGELFVAQGGASNVVRFRFDPNENPVFTGVITAGLCCHAPRGIAISPWGELFVSLCCGVNKILRFRFDASGQAVPNGEITDPELSDPNGMTFSPWGELFVANSTISPDAKDIYFITRYRFGAAARGHRLVARGTLTAPNLIAPSYLAFSPWDELFVGNGPEDAKVSRFTFDAAHNATFNGAFPMLNGVAGVAFAPSTAENHPPDCSHVFLDRPRPWPPDHRLVAVTATGASDPDPGDAATLAINAVTQDEPVEDQGDSTTPDAILTRPHTNHASIRVERSDFGDGRIYTLHYTATDTRGARCQGTATVSVPLEQGGPAAQPPYLSTAQP